MCGLACPAPVQTNVAQPPVRARAPAGRFGPCASVAAGERGGHPDRRPGLGSVFYGPYMGMIERLAAIGRARVTAVYDVDEGKRRAAGLRLGLDPGCLAPEAVIESDDVDVVLVLTSMNEHGALASAALAAGKHVLVEKPMATSLEEAAALMRAGRGARPGIYLRAAHRALDDVPRDARARVEAGEIGRLLLARARYGWAGPGWGRWFYQRGGGALFDLGVYNVTALCGFFGPARRVTAMVGVAIPERIVEGELMRVQADDNAHVLLDFGEARFASITTGFTMQKYRSPAIELYGTDGVLQLLGDDWAPEGFEQWRNAAAPGSCSRSPTRAGRGRTACATSSTARTGRRPVTRPEHAYHALEVMLAAKALGAPTGAREIATTSRALDLASDWVGGRHRGCTTRARR